MKFISILLASLLLSVGAFASNVKEGATIPSFKVSELTGGGVVDIKSFRNQVVYLDFWASWCGPCRESFPLLNDMRNELKSKGFEVIAINVDSNSDLGLKFLKETPVDYVIGKDSSGKLPAYFNVEVMPTSYIIDKKGVVREIHEGFKSKDMPKLRALVSQLLAE